MAITDGQRLSSGDLNNYYPSLTTTITSSLASVTLSIGDTHQRFQVNWFARGTAATPAEQIYVRLNNDSGNNYLIEQTQTNNTATTNLISSAQAQIQMGTIPAASATANYFGSGNFTIDGVNDTANFKTMVGVGSGEITTTNMYVGVYAGEWLSTAVVTSVTLFPASGSFATGSTFSLYGISG